MALDASAYPSLEDARDATLVEGEHLWIAWTPASRPEPMICCRWCGIVKPYNDPKPCRGLVRVRPR